MKATQELMPPELARYKRWLGQQATSPPAKIQRLEPPTTPKGSPGNSIGSPSSDKKAGAQALPIGNLPPNVLQAMGFQTATGGVMTPQGAAPQATQSVGVIPLSAVHSGSTSSSGPNATQAAPAGPSTRTRMQPDTKKTETLTDRCRREPEHSQRCQPNNAYAMLRHTTLRNQPQSHTHTLAHAHAHAHAHARTRTCTHICTRTRTHTRTSTRIRTCKWSTIMRALEFTSVLGRALQCIKEVSFTTSDVKVDLVGFFLQDQWLLRMLG